MNTNYRSLLIESLLLEYEDIATEARAEAKNGNKFKAIALAIEAFKIKSKIENLYLDKLLEKKFNE